MIDTDNIKENVVSFGSWIMSSVSNLLSSTQSPEETNPELLLDEGKNYNILLSHINAELTEMKKYCRECNLQSKNRLLVINESRSKNNSAFFTPAIGSERMNAEGPLTMEDNERMELSMSLQTLFKSYPRLEIERFREPGYLSDLNAQIKEHHTQVSEVYARYMEKVNSVLNSDIEETKSISLNL